MLKQAASGSDAALALARRYGAVEATAVLRGREAGKFKVVAAATGLKDRPVPRLTFAHHIERNGTVIFDLGRGRRVIDSAISKQIKLNNAAALDAAGRDIALLRHREVRQQVRVALPG